MKCCRLSWTRYSNLENDVGKLAEFSAHNRNVDFAGRIIYDDEDVEVFNFGKYKGNLSRRSLNRILDTMAG